MKAKKTKGLRKKPVVNTFTIDPYYFSWQKRSLDIGICIAALIILAVPLVILMSMLLVLSGFPLFFAQLRTGQNKQPFVMWKFRSMKVGTDADKLKPRFQKLNNAPWPMFKVYNDPRYTKIGHFLSKTGIDELPQIWNILKGDMSIVGPRPLPVAESAELGNEWNFRYQVRPGILSEWAVSPDRYASLKKWKELEKETLQKGSLLYDLTLIWRTVQYLSAV